MERIVYLGGLGRGERLSPHLRSRQEVGRILRESGVPTAELRASIVLGEGSASYDLLSAVVDHVPAAAVPDWARSQDAQPIHVDDVVAYLHAALDVDLPASSIYEIGGPDRLSYLDLMNLYATEHGLTRFFVSVPVLPGVDLWQRALERVAPEQLTVWLRLVESMRNETTVQDDAAGSGTSRGVRPRRVPSRRCARGRLSSRRPCHTFGTESAQTRNAVLARFGAMDETDRVLARLRRIEELPEA